MGLALKQKFIDTLRNEWDLQDWPVTGLLTLALVAVRNVEVRDNWNIFGQGPTEASSM